MTNVLFGADVTLLAAGVCVVAVWAVRRIVRGTRDALDPPSEAATRLTPDLVLVPAFVYALTAVVLTTAAKGLAEPLREKFALVGGSVCQIAGSSACLVIAQRYFNGGWRRLLFGPRAGQFGRGAGLSILLWLAALPLCEATLWLTNLAFAWLWPGYEFPEHSVVDALVGTDQPLPFVVALWIGAAAVAPVAEELFFRGILQTALRTQAASLGWPRRSANQRWLAIGLTAALFGLVHAAQWHAVPALAVFGLLLGFAYERTGALLPAITVHVLFNLKTLIWVALGATGQR